MHDSLLNVNESTQCVLTHIKDIKTKYKMTEMLTKSSSTIQTAQQRNKSEKVIPSHNNP